MLEFHGSPSRFAVNVFDHTSDTTCDFRHLSAQKLAWFSSYFQHSSALVYP